MPTPDSLRDYYAERAMLAYAMERVQGLDTQAPSAAECYTKIHQELAVLEAAFAQGWRLPSSGAVAPLPWCSVCGRTDRLLLPGRMLCSVCEAATTQEEKDVILVEDACP